MRSGDCFKADAVMFMLGDRMPWYHVTATTSVQKDTAIEMRDPYNRKARLRQKRNIRIMQRHKCRPMSEGMKASRIVIVGYRTRVYEVARDYRRIFSCNHSTSNAA